MSPCVVLPPPSEVVIFLVLPGVLCEHAVFEPAYTQAWKIIIFDCLLVGVIMWMAYRASFTSELSVIRLNMPFTDLESLSKTNFK